ncbi:tetratricopeptide repeat-containing sulfotransferase family protein [Pseudoalteromonas umbrosa]|uniref:tetratricopeptide repeat-containing sulfotransferase family protein n=1 Tax=Pseudoalteromonas umbrosa TaxID=3048489 RepID=UPI0024C36E54|nr:tetratricopeptide repeat-containing sulfotransferase family protein [Pseudoalteromonas sp. B95]MDK1287791.1 sulfotransferase [Pseudoalteromonas sp. B95]
MLLLDRATELLLENRLREAEFMFKQVLKQNPTNGKALFGLGRICMRLEQYDNAIYYLKRACEHLPKMLDPLYALADAFIAVGSPVDAKTVLEYALSVARHNAQIHYHLGQFYLDHGFIDNAYQVFKKGLECPESGVSVFMIFELLQLASSSEIPDLMARLERFDGKFEHPKFQIVTYHAFATAHQALGDNKEAFEYYKKANELQLTQCEFRTADMLPFYNRLLATCDEDFFSKPTDKVKSTFTPVFIVGLPRTGSTLLEQILTQHSQVGTIGESIVLSDKIVPYLEMRTERPFPDCIYEPSTSMLDYCRSVYVDEIKKSRVQEEAVINKLPANFQNIGLIYRIFPNARIIHLTRDFMANAWSVYSNHFAENEPYFCSLPEFKLYSEIEQQVMFHFSSHLKRNVFNVSYEKLIDDPERTIQKILNFIYLKYEPECMEFYKSRSKVSTLSKTQVRQPIHNRSLNRWQAFEKEIEKELTQPE